MPLFDGHGITIHTSGEGYHTLEEVTDFLDAIRSVPALERADFYAAVNVHWKHLYPSTGGGDPTLHLKPNGMIEVWSPYTFWNRENARDDLDIPDLESNPYDI